MEKLELKDIAGHLPYGLKCKFKNEVCDAIGTTNGNIIISKYISEVCSVDACAYLEDVKPILFPMKCLIEEVAINGGTFVPIIELAKLFHKEDAYKVTHYEDPRYMDWGYSGEDTAWVINCCVENDSNRYLYYSIYKHKLNELPLNLVDKLNELHFDYRGLIERGLAVSALDYNNPYK